MGSQTPTLAMDMLQKRTSALTSSHIAEMTTVVGILLPITSRGGLPCLQRNLQALLQSLVNTVADLRRVRLYFGIDEDDLKVKRLLSPLHWPGEASPGPAATAQSILARLCHGSAIPNTHQEHAETQSRCVFYAQCMHCRCIVEDILTVLKRNALSARMPSSACIASKHLHPAP